MFTFTNKGKIIKIKSDKLYHYLNTYTVKNMFETYEEVKIYLQKLYVENRKKGIGTFKELL